MSSSLIGPGKNLTEAHLEKELAKLSKRFAKLDKDILLGKLKENNGHTGKTTHAIFEEGGEGVEEAKTNFYKLYTGAFISKVDIPNGDFSYLWNIKYDPQHMPNRAQKKVIDKNGKEHTLFECNSHWYTSEEEEIKYPNNGYFDELSMAGDSPHAPGEWGTDPCEIYDELHPLNTEGLVMTIHELNVTLNIWKLPLLGTHPFIDDDGVRHRYIGQEANRQKKKKLPEGWSRWGSEEYNGLYMYKNLEKGEVQWEHP